MIQNEEPKAQPMRKSAVYLDGLKEKLDNKSDSSVWIIGGGGGGGAGSTGKESDIWGQGIGGIAENGKRHFYTFSNHTDRLTGSLNKKNKIKKMI